jgi:hypothetical protein
MRDWKRLHIFVFSTALLLLTGCGGGYSSSSGGGNTTPPPSIPGVPAGVAATAGDQQVALTWTAVSGATSYHVKRSATTGGPYTQEGAPTSATFTDTGLTDGTKYFYVVSAVNSAGESANSTEVSATPAAPAPGVPSGLSAVSGDAQVVLSWTAGANASTYSVQRSSTTGGPYTQVGTPSSTTFTDSGLTNTTTYFYVVASMNSGGTSANSSEVSATPAIITGALNASQTKTISPYIYGINSYTGGANPPFTLDRAGGNRWTAYNWENNFSNAGSDFEYESDQFLDSSTTPADAVSKFITADQSVGLASLMTVQLQGLVSADDSGPVSVTNPPDLSRFKTVVDKKSTVDSDPFTTNPPTTDANVYMDEFLWALDQKFTGKNIFGASPTIPTFVSLDNEPELWNSTHLEVQGKTQITSDAYIAKTITLAEALKDQFPNVIIFGPVNYGFQGIYAWQSELSPTPTGNNWFPDKYLTELKAASTTYGKPLVDDYDFHWYPEVYDSTKPTAVRITNMSSSTLTAEDIELITQAPRDLWDPTFHDPNNSNPWIYQELGSTPVQIISRLQNKIAADYPGTKLSITEYEGGGWNHIAGTISEADMLGIFGVQGLFAANLWPPSGTFDYAVAGFRAYRGFDGAGSNFGDTSVQATSSDVSKVSIYASLDSTNPAREVLVAINRSNAVQTVAFSGVTVVGTATVYQMTAASAAGQATPIHPVTLSTTIPVAGSSFNVTLPAMSVSTISIQ